MSTASEGGVKIGIDRRIGPAVVLVAIAGALTYATLRSVEQGGLPSRLVVVAVIWLVCVALAIRNPVQAVYMLLIAVPFFSHIRRLYLFYNPPTGAGGEFLDPIHAIPDLLLATALVLSFNSPLLGSNTAGNTDYSRLAKAVKIYFAIGFLQILNPAAGSITKGILAFRENMLFLLVFFLPARVFRSTKAVERLLVIALATSLVSAAYGLKQCMFGFSEAEQAYIRGFPSLRVAGNIVRAFSTLNSAGHFADLMLIAIVLSVVMLKLHVRAQTKLISAAGIPLLVAGLSVTFVRSSWFGTIAALVFLFGISGARSRAALWGRIVLLTVGAFAVMQLASSDSMRDPNVSAKKAYTTLFSEQGQALRSPLQVNTVQGRVQQISQAVPWILRHPLGAGNGSAGKFSTRNAPYVENQYFIVIIELGWLGFAAFLWLIWTVFRCGFRVIGQLQDNGMKLLARATLSLFAGALVATLAGPHIAVHPLDVYLWLLAGTIPLLPRFEAHRMAVGCAQEPAELLPVSGGAG